MASNNEHTATKPAAMSDMDTASPSRSTRTRRDLLGLRRISSEAKQFIREKARTVRHHGAERDGNSIISEADDDDDLSTPSTPTTSTTGSGILPATSSTIAVSSSQQATVSEPSLVDSKPLPSPPATATATASSFLRRLSPRRLDAHNSTPAHPRPSLDSPLVSSPARTTTAATFKFQTSTPALTSPKPHLHHLSALRVGLTSLVVLHHTAIPYGGTGNWGWQSPSATPTTPSAVLIGFNVLNQSWFMAGFFWMAGYFTQLQLQKRGREQQWRLMNAPVEVAGRGTATIAASSTRQEGGTTSRTQPAVPRTPYSMTLVLSRAQRLALPALAYTTIGGPIFKLMCEAHQRGWILLPLHDAQRVLATYFSSLRGVRGPVWFGVVLFGFDALAVLTHAVGDRLQNKRVEMPSKQVQRMGAYVGIAVTIAASFYIRTIYPVGKTYEPLNLQPAFLPGYIFAYTVGHLAATNGDLYFHSLLPNVRARPKTMLAASTALMLAGMVAIAAAPELLLRTATWPQQVSLDETWRLAAGGYNLPALLYAIWNDVGIVTLLPAVVAICERYLGRSDLFTIRLPALQKSSTTSSKAAGKQKASVLPQPQKSFQLPRYAYATFLVHPIASLAVELLVEKPLVKPFFSWVARFTAARTASEVVKHAVNALGPPLVTMGVGAINILASWMAGVALVECVPWVARFI
jgi:glucans biosynthesis protein C